MVHPGGETVQRTDSHLREVMQEEQGVKIEFCLLCPQNPIFRLVNCNSIKTIICACEIMQRGFMNWSYPRAGRGARLFTSEEQ